MITFGLSDPAFLVAGQAAASADPTASRTLSGWDPAGFNGVYLYQGQYNGKPQYSLGGVGSGSKWISFINDFGMGWLLSTHDGDSPFGSNEASSESLTNTPELATGWVSAGSITVVGTITV